MNLPVPAAPDCSKHDEERPRRKGHHVCARLGCGAAVCRATQTHCSTACYVEACRAGSTAPSRCCNEEECAFKDKDGNPGAILPGSQYGRKCPGCFKVCKNDDQNQKRANDATVARGSDAKKPRAAPSTYDKTRWSGEDVEVLIAAAEAAVSAAGPGSGLDKIDWAVAKRGLPQRNVQQISAKWAGLQADAHKAAEGERTALQKRVVAVCERCRQGQ